MIGKDELVDKYNMTAEELAELDTSEKAYEKGQWPSGKISRIGRPPIYNDDELQSVTIRLRKSRICMIDNAAKALGESRSDFVRDAVDKALASI